MSFLRAFIRVHELYNSPQKVQATEFLYQIQETYAILFSTSCRNCKFGNKKVWKQAVKMFKQKINAKKLLTIFIAGKAVQ